MSSFWANRSMALEREAACFEPLNVDDPWFRVPAREHNAAVTAETLFRSSRVSDLPSYRFCKAVGITKKIAADAIISRYLFHQQLIRVEAYDYHKPVVLVAANEFLCKEIHARVFPDREFCLADARSSLLSQASWDDTCIGLPGTHIDFDLILKMASRLNHIVVKIDFPLRDMEAFGEEFLVTVHDFRDRNLRDEFFNVVVSNDDGARLLKYRLRSVVFSARDYDRAHYLYFNHDFHPDRNAGIYRFLNPVAREAVRYGPEEGSFLPENSILDDILLAAESGDEVFFRSRFDCTFRGGDA